MSATTAIDSINADGYIFDGLEIVVADWETFWGTNYSLRNPKLSTSEYVRDERFKSHGVGVYLPAKGESYWVAGDDERDLLASIDWSNVALLCHNTEFDGFILHEHHGHHPRLYMDTLSMSRANWGLHVSHKLGDIGERCGFGSKKGSDILTRTKNIRDLSPEQFDEMGYYCTRDVELTWLVFKYLIEQEAFPPLEVEQVHLSLRAFCDPRLHINPPLAQAELDQERTEKQAICDQLGITAAQLQSADKFAELLKGAGLEDHEIPRKWSEKKQQDIYAFAKNDEDFLALLDDPLAKPYVEARLRVKSTIQETKAARLLKHGDPGPLPISIRYWKAHTGRWGGGDKLNPQNFPAGRGRQTQRLRNAIIAPPGYVMVRVDSSQIEPRYLAWMAKDERLLDVFRADKDPYLHMASDLYGERFDDPEKYATERQLGKCVLIALGYGMGLQRFIATAKMQFGLDLPEDTAKWALNRYRELTRNTVGAFWTKMHQGLFHSTNCAPGDELRINNLGFDHHKVWLSNGCAIWYPRLQYRSSNFYYKTRRTWRKIYGAMATENVNQGECRNVVAWQTLPIARRYFVCLLAHDETVFLAPKGEAEEAKAFALECFARTPPWAPGLPVQGKAIIDTCYGK